ncbi:MAG: TIGR03619 family F420-dependent LLM class oxidoreductase [Thermoanaerobacterales bacterium]|jgi:probable F420-dependent oxidoreductase|nr:TIGR03619 family F420-dependent LLM class oxidoreductase [Thermoanaerobacterales bacterium]
MRFGIHLPQYGRVAGPDAIARAARHAEELGFDDVWVSDHVVHPADQGYPSPYLYDPLLTLTWAAAATTRVGLGTSVLVASQYHPLWLANATASLDALSGGRLTLGVGVGWSAAEFAALGQDFRTRGRRTDEILEILRICWTTDPSSFHGEHYAFDDMRVLPKPAHPIDVWIGGGSEPAYRRAKRAGATGFQLIGLKPDTVREPIARLRRDHPDPATFTISLRTGWDPQGMDPDEIAREREGFEAAGVQHVVAAPWRTDLDSWLRSMDLLAGILGLEGAPA